MNETKDVRSVPFKNYVILTLIFIAVVLMTLYLFKWYQIKKEEQTSDSYIIEKNLTQNQIKSLQDLKQVLSETPSKFVVYITYHNSSRIYNIEKKFDSLFKDYNIANSFYVFDITDLKNNMKDYNKILNDELDINVTGYPVIIFYEEGQIVSYKKISSFKDIKKILEKYDFEKNSL